MHCTKLLPRVTGYKRGSLAELAELAELSPLAELPSPALSLLPSPASNRLFHLANRLSENWWTSDKRPLTMLWPGRTPRSPIARNKALGEGRSMQLASNETMKTENINTTGADTPIADAAWEVKTRKRAVKVNIAATSKDKKVKLIDGVKVALKNLAFPDRQYLAPNALEIVRAMQADTAVAERVTGLVDAALGTLAGSGEPVGDTDAVYPDLATAASAISVTWAVPTLPIDWTTWLAIQPETGTRVSDAAIRAAQDAMLDAWVADMYLSNDAGPCNAQGEPSKTLIYPPQALGWRAALETLRKACNPRASFTVAQIADMLREPTFVGIKPGQSERLVSWLSDSGMLDGLFDLDLTLDVAPDKAQQRASDVLVKARDLATGATTEAAADESEAVELDF
jgi:hypothetical protein